VNIPYIDVTNPSHGSHRTERQVAQLIATPIALFVICLFYVLKLLAKGLYKAKRWLARISVFILVFFIAGSNLTFSVSAPKAQAALDKPLVVVNKTASSSATLTPDQQIIYSFPHGDELWQIYGLESSFGKNDGCKARGLYNGFGFRQNSSEWVCYATFKEAVSNVNAWIEQHKNLPLGQQLCLYNRGTDEPTCEYARNFLKI